LRSIAILTVVAFLGLAAVGRAQDITKDEHWDEIARGFQLPRAGALVRDGVEAVRIFAVSGLQGPLPAIVIARAPGGAATITTVSAREVAGRWEQVTRTAPLSEADWRRLFQTAAAAMREPDKTPFKPGIDLGMVVVCNDAASDAMEIIAEGHVTRRAEIACQFQAFHDASRDFAEAAVAAFPPCAKLPALYDGDFSRIRVCNEISGDLDAAVAIVNHIQQHDANELYPDAAPSIVAVWPGRPRIEGAAAFKALETGLDAGIAPRFSVSAVRGEGPDRATLEGDVLYLDNEEGSAYAAPFTEAWALEEGRWRLERLTVGAFERRAPVKRLPG